MEKVHTTVEQNTLISSIISQQQPLKPATVVVTLHYLGLKPTTKEVTSQHNVTRTHNTKKIDYLIHPKLWAISICLHRYLTHIAY